jgi:hypothetical protein
MSVSLSRMRKIVPGVVALALVITLFFVASSGAR